MTPDEEYEGRRVRVRPDLLKLESHILGFLTDEQKRDGPESTIVKAEFASGRLFFDLDIDNVPEPQRFKAMDCHLIEGTES